MKRKGLFNRELDLSPVWVTASPARAGGESPQLFGLGRLFSSGDDEKRTVRARRRRRDTSDSGDRERAAAPRRRRERDEPPPPPRPPSGGSGGSSQRPPSPRPRPSGGGGGGIPIVGGGSRMILFGILALVFLCICAVVFIFGGLGGDGDDGYVPPPTAEVSYAPTAEQAPPTAAPRPTTAPQPFTPPATSGEGQTWLVMLYQDADDKVLEHDIYVDLNEAERIGSSDRVHIVAQVDRYRAGYQGDGDWTSTKRFYITQDDDLQRVYSQEVEDLGEVNMADGETLVDFVTWAVDTFPADKHVLIMSDHGMGWPGGWSDPEPKGQVDRSIPLAAALGDELFLMELDEALEKVRASTDLEAFELIGMDACLMGHLEVFTALAPHAHYAVASQEVEPALGWAYTSFLQGLTANPDMDGAELGRLIVDSYIVDDQRIVDDEARADMLRQSSPMGGLFGMLSGGGPVASAEQLRQQMGRGSTLTAIDLSAMPDLLDSVNGLAYELQDANQKDVARARTYAQSFTSIFGKSVPASYLDLGHFAELVAQKVRGGNVAQAAQEVQASLDRAVVAEKHGSSKPGATGVSIYFPNSQLYKSPVTGPESYTAVARRFADASLWDDYLNFHYTGRPFEATAGEISVPERGEIVTGPGAGEIQLSPITLSDNVAAPGDPVLLSVDIAGDSVGYVYLFVGLYDQASNSIWLADSDYLESPETREVRGVYYPDWGEGEFTMEFEWDPVVYAIDDGVNRVVALFTPEQYGASYEDAVYSVDGIYTFANGGETRSARLLFRDGVLRQVYSFSGEGTTGAPREILPLPGDTFTVTEKWLDLDQQGRVSGKATQEGGTLTFGDQMFTWEELDAPVGNYLVGFIVEDLDGNSYEAYSQVKVE